MTDAACGAAGVAGLVMRASAVAVLVVRVADAAAGSAREAGAAGRLATCNDSLDAGAGLPPLLSVHDPARSRSELLAVIRRFVTLSLESSAAARRR